MPYSGGLLHESPIQVNELGINVNILNMPDSIKLKCDQQDAEELNLAT